MAGRFTTEKDPLWWSAAIALAFTALAWHRLGIPSQIYFDEVHYVTAARELLAGKRFNPEHPMLGKAVIAAAIAWLGDAPLNWRIPSLIGGGIGLFAFARLVWLVSGRRFATLAATFLVATDFAWFIQSRIAMLDMIMMGLGMTGLWLFAGAVRNPPGGRWRLIAAGVLFGLALGAKWSIAPLIVLPGLLILAGKLRDRGVGGLFARSGGPVPGITLAEAALWLGLVPLTVYWLTFWPAFHWTPEPVDPWDPLGWHRTMLDLQDSVRKPHPYRSVWYEWVGNWRAIWYLYQPVDGAQRGIVLIGNPLTMLVGLIGFAWCLWVGLWRRRHDAVVFAGLYAVALGLWVVTSKPVQFYYHYLLPGTFLMACLALLLDALWRLRGRWRWLAPAVLLGSAAMFVHFYPIISAAKLCCGRPSFEYWMWLKSWR